MPANHCQPMRQVPLSRARVPGFARRLQEANIKANLFLADPQFRYAGAPDHLRAARRRGRCSSAGRVRPIGPPARGGRAASDAGRPARLLAQPAAVLRILRAVWRLPGGGLSGAGVQAHVWAERNVRRQVRVHPSAQGAANGLVRERRLHRRSAPATPRPRRAQPRRLRCHPSHRALPLRPAGLAGGQLACSLTVFNEIRSASYVNSGGDASAVQLSKGACRSCGTSSGLCPTAAGTFVSAPPLWFQCVDVGATSCGLQPCRGWKSDAGLAVTWCAVQPTAGLVLIVVLPGLALLICGAVACTRSGLLRRLLARSQPKMADGRITPDEEGEGERAAGAAAAPLQAPAAGLGRGAPRQGGKK